MLHQIQLLRHLNVLCNNPFGDLCSNNNKPFGDLRSCHFSFLRVTFSKRYFNVRLGFDVVAVDISLLQPAYVAYEKVMFSVVSVCRGGSRYVTTTSDAMGYPPPPDHHMNLLKFVHLEPHPTTRTCSNLFTWDPPIPYHLWTPYIGRLTFD